MAYRSLFVAPVREQIKNRLGRITPDTRPRFGSFDAGRCICHLIDAFRGSLGELDMGLSQKSFFASALGRWMAIDSPIPWPKGLKVPAALFTTQADPAHFTRDRDTLFALIDRFAAGHAATTTWGTSPVFGALSPEQWSRLNARHCDHHLKQFGV